MHRNLIIADLVPVGVLRVFPRTSRSFPGPDIQPQVSCFGILFETDLALNPEP